MVTAHDVLVRAREIQARGHCKGNARGPDGSRCMVASVTLAEEDLLGEGCSALMEALGALGEAVSCGSFEVVSWSDAHDLPEVLATFDKAIAATAPLVVPAEWTPEPVAA